MTADDEGTARLGPAAELSVLRAASSAGDDSQKTALKQLLDEEKKERIILQCLPTQATLSICTNVANNDEADVSRCGEEKGEVKKTTAEGVTVITSERLLFWANQEEDGKNDLVVDAVCIDLHALCQDPVSVYLQVQLPADAPGSSRTLELALVPIDEASRKKECSSMYDKITFLINLHPTDPHGDDNDGYVGGGDGDDDIMFMASPPPITTGSEADSGSELSNEDREAMLARLDGMLVVPPDLEQRSTSASHAEHDDRFDDASDDPLL